MVEQSDIVVIGSGHNSMITAAYLALAGLSVTVLEERSVLGGGTAMEELTLPGFLHDPAATAHIGLQYNPVIAADELGILRDGLQYAFPEPLLVFHCDDGATITMYSDLDATMKEIARFSKPDAESFRQLLKDWESILDAWMWVQSQAPMAPGSGPPPQGIDQLFGMAMPSVRDVICTRFQDDHIRALFMWLVVQGGQPIDAAGTGLMLPFLVGTLWQFSWPHPIGGSGALIRALARVLEAHDGRVLCGHRVTRILVENGRAAGVVTSQLERFDAKKAVVSGAHAMHLVDLLYPHQLPSAFEALQGWRHGHSQFVVHLALPSTPTYRTADGACPVTISGYGSVEGILGQFKGLDQGVLGTSGRAMSAICSSVADETRAPDGCATLKIVTPAPYALNGNRSQWEDAKEFFMESLLQQYAQATDGYDVGDELARVAHSPVDLEAMNRNFVHGGFTGGEMTPDQLGPNRPVKGWASYRMPVPGLYQTGASTHPGGGVAGFSGRNAAEIVLQDLGIETGKLISRSAPSPAAP